MTDIRADAELILTDAGVNPDGADDAFDAAAIRLARHVLDTTPVQPQPAPARVTISYTDGDGTTHHSGYDPFGGMEPRAQWTTQGDPQE